VRAALDPEITLGAATPVVGSIETAVFEAVPEARAVEVRVVAAT
jgi:hypothetical protein